ncbi:MAG: SDR family oxidoreductase [Verrucomicrobia bacterium]|nr:SDR family oxidoreductase [Verrucomicrobiota bacterium]
MKSDLFDLSGKIAVVTGGARGLGQAAAIGLATYGADVAVIDLQADSCGGTRREIEAAGRLCRTYGCDVADEHTVARTVAQIAADFGRIDILVNIAGITARIPTVEITSEQVRQLTDVNYHGIFWMCKEVGKVMLAQGSGNIVNMSALGGGLVGTGRGNAAYSSTKGAIGALTKELACEWGGKGIRVNAVAPCWFQTDMNATSIFSNKHFMDQVMTKLPMRRIGQPREIVGPIVFLASAASSMITGLVLPVDGGAAATCPIEWKLE